jgi:chaperonin cofactor prefoldin
MKTIPNKVIYTKEEFAELQKEFESLENEVRTKELQSSILSEFVKKLQTILDFREDALTAKELVIIHDQLKDKFTLISR